MIILSNDNIANIPGSKQSLSGGRARFARDFSRYLSQEGHTWIGVVSKLTTTNQTRIIKTKSPNYWQLQVPMEFHRKIQKTGTQTPPETIFAPAIEKCCELIKKTKADIIFINGNSLYPWIFLQAGRQMNIPIITQHAGIMKISLDRNKNKHAKTLLKVMHKIEKDFSALADKNIFISKLSQREYNKRVIKFDQKKQLVITLPYNKNFIDAKKQTKNKIKIGLVARWDQIKNHDGVAELAELAWQKGMNWEFYSVTVIPKNENNATLKEKYIRHIKIKKPMEKTPLKKFYQRMDLMILPSHFETLGFVVMEAALAGTGTIISPTVGWIDDYKKLGLSDWVADFNRPEQAIKKIKKVIGRPVPIKFTKHLLKNNNPTKIFNQYLNLFKKTIKERL